MDVVESLDCGVWLEEVACWNLAYILVLPVQISASSLEFLPQCLLIVNDDNLYM